MICGKCNTKGIENQAGGNSFWYCRGCKDEIAAPATPLAKAYGAENNLERLKKLYEYADDSFQFAKSPILTDEQRNAKKAKYLKSTLNIDCLLRSTWIGKHPSDKVEDVTYWLATGLIDQESARKLLAFS